MGKSLVSCFFLRHSVVGVVVATNHIFHHSMYTISGSITKLHHTEAAYCYRCRTCHVVWRVCLCVQQYTDKLCKIGWTYWDADSCWPMESCIRRVLYLCLLYLRRWRGSVWFIISERNSLGLLFKSPVFSLIDTRLFTVYTCSFTVSFNTFYISPYYVHFSTR